MILDQLVEWPPPVSPERFLDRLSRPLIRRRPVAEYDQQAAVVLRPARLGHTRPWSIFAIVDNPTDNLTVMNVRWPIRSRCGSFRQPTYPFKPPYTFRIYVASPFGDRSPELKVPLR
jgi:hypothetical protein